jgi:hypothetical protein
MKIIIEDAEGDIEAIRAEVVVGMIKELVSKVGLISPAQAGGILDLSPAGLDGMGLEKVDLLGNGRVIRYRLDDVVAKLKDRTIKAKRKPQPSRR